VTLMSVYLDLQPALRAYFRSRVSDPSQVDDLLQDVALRILKREGESIDNKTGYVFRIASSAFKDRLRRDKTGEADARNTHIHDMDVRDPQPSVEERLEARQRLNLLLRSIDKLPDEVRETFTLHRLKGYKLKEIANIQRLPLHKVKKNMEKALSFLASRVWSD